MRQIILILLCFILLCGCSQYSLNTAKKNGDVVEGPGGPLNIDKLDTFKKDVDSNNKSTLRIVSFTDEGDPNIGSLEFQGKRISYTYSTHEVYGSNKTKQSKTHCDALEIVDGQEIDVTVKARYILSGCDKVIGLEGPKEGEILIYTTFK